MSKTNSTPSLFAIVVNCVLVAITFGGWLVPLGLYFVSKYVYGKRPSYFVVALNTLLMTVTGFLWSIPLGIRYYFVLKNK